MYTRLNWLFWETLIIVVGVLLALSVDDYWTDVQERRLEMDYLQRLRADIQADIEHADAHMAESVARKIQALDAYIASLDD